MLAGTLRPWDDMTASSTSTDVDDWKIHKKSGLVPILGTHPFTSVSPCHSCGYRD